MYKIYIGSPANRFTGGPTLAHQLCAQLRENELNAYMYYYHVKDRHKIVHEQYQPLRLPYVTKIKDEDDIVIVAPETAPDILKHHKKAKKVVWWMSVDNYFDKWLTSRRNMILNVGGIFKYDVFGDEVFHFVQSVYAKEFLIDKGVANSRIAYLSDYIDDIFFDMDHSEIKKSERKNIILYNPRRGYEFTKKIVEKLPEYKFVPLQGMSQQEMIETMLKSKLYIDFGNHPGKDRIPREAAICGCCVVTSLNGSARNAEDVFIDSKYKFNDEEKELVNICTCVNDIMIAYEEHVKDFEPYRERIRREKAKFKTDAINAFSILTD